MQHLPPPNPDNVDDLRAFALGHEVAFQRAASGGLMHQAVRLPCGHAIDDTDLDALRQTAITACPRCEGALPAVDSLEPCHSTRRAVGRHASFFPLGVAHAPAHALRAYLSVCTTAQMPPDLAYRPAPMPPFPGAQIALHDDLRDTPEGLIPTVGQLLQRPLEGLGRAAVPSNSVGEHSATPQPPSEQLLDALAPVFLLMRSSASFTYLQRKRLDLCLAVDVAGHDIGPFYVSMATSMTCAIIKGHYAETGSIAQLLHDALKDSDPLQNLRCARALFVYCQQLLRSLPMPDDRRHRDHLFRKIDAFLLKEASAVGPHLDQANTRRLSQR